MKKLLFFHLLFSVVFFSGCENIPGLEKRDAITHPIIEEQPLASKSIPLFSGFLEEYTGFCLGSENEERTFLQNNSSNLSVQVSDSDYLYSYSYAGVSNCTPNSSPDLKFQVHFKSPLLIIKKDIERDSRGGSFTIPKLKLTAIDSSLTQQYSFGLRCLPRKEDWLHRSFPSGSGELFVPAANEMKVDMNYPYINHLGESVERHSFMFPYGRRATKQEDTNLGKEDCLIEIGEKSDFESLPFNFGKGFEDATIAITRNKNQTANCMQYFPNHAMVMAFYNDRVQCSLWLDDATTLQEISQP